MRHITKGSNTNQIDENQTQLSIIIISIIAFGIGMFLGYYEGNKQSNTLKMQALEKGYAEFDKIGEFRFKQSLTKLHK